MQLNIKGMALKALVLLGVAIIPFLFSITANATVLNGTVINGCSNDKLCTLIRYGGLTFSKDYTDLPVGEVTQAQLDADFALGSKLATFTAARSASAPATYVDSNGVIQLVTNANTGRIQGGYYDSTGFHAQKGLMIEAAGTNIVKDSYFSEATLSNYWTAVQGSGGTGVIEASTDYTNPYLGGSVLKFRGTKKDDRFSDNPSPLTEAAVTYTISMLVRGSGKVAIRWSDGSTDTNGSEITLSNTGWQIITRVVTGGVTVSGYTGLRLLTDQSVTCYIAYIQVEASPYATSFIPTTTASLTRAADNLTYQTINNLNGVSNTIFLKLSSNWNGADLTATTPICDTDPDRVLFTLDGTTDAYAFTPNFTDSDTSTSKSTSIPVKNTSMVVSGVSYGSGEGTNSEIYINGLSENSSTTNYTQPDIGTNMSIGRRYSSPYTYLNGIIQSVAIYNRALTAAEVLTATNTINQ